MHTSTRSALVLSIRGRITSSTCRVTRQGVPVVELEIADVPSGQTVHITHRYPDASFASSAAARALANRMRGQHAELQAINPRFKAHRLECEADLINTPEPTQTRKDFE